MYQNNNNNNNKKITKISIYLSIIVVAVVSVDTGVIGNAMKSVCQLAPVSLL